MIRIVFSLLVLIFALAPVTGARATPQTSPDGNPVTDPYTVENVHIHVAEDNAATARDKAFRMAQVEAFNIMASRLGQEHPSVPEPQSLSSMVRDFEIRNEKLSHKSYQAEFVVRFRPEWVNRYLGVAGYGNETAEARESGNGKILILPFQATPKGAVLWDKDTNIFWGQLKQSQEKYGDPAKKIIIPDGTIEDKTDVWEKDPNILSMSSIRKIKARYNVDLVMVIVMRSASNPLDRCTLEYYRTDTDRIQLITKQDTIMPSCQDAGENVMDILTRHIKEQTPPEKTPYLSEADRMREEGVVETIPETPALAVEINPVTPQQLAQDVRQSPQGMSFAGKMTIQFEAIPLQELERFRTFLQQQSSVRSFKILSLRKNIAEFEISYEDWNSFLNALAVKNYHTRHADNGTLIITP